eukprot:CAMPEP_0119304458 /NCGR_PEP_ID=MMETSP1333-20130426/5683_1 /TAXON_ID=418940 /ORGANISM="Scyphosphaera apsteinii, Strain RCC1455" /LENGTH=178 /DNA_ID=CAMNT_0007307353 /DNA_START=35 /DNA_END=571 /DNA_ORIENTATION=-
MDENVKSNSKVKSSEQRKIIAAVLDQYPALTPFIEDILPKKEPLFVCKCKDFIQLIVAPNSEFIFFQCRSGPFIPTLRLLHKYPDILPKFRVDRGAIRFVLSGANIMSPGLTSAGGMMDDVAQDAVVAIMAEGKEHALAIGVTADSTEDIRKKNSGVAVENTHYLNDALWIVRSVPHE